MSLNETVLPGPDVIDVAAPFGLALDSREVLLGTLLFGLASVLVLIWPRKAANLPPGPKPGFFVGNRNQAPAAKPWRWFKDLNDQYGDVVYLRMGQTPTVVLGSAQAAWDLLEKRSNIYSSRPRFIMGQELLSNNMRGLMSGYNDTWRRWRKVLHGSFMQKAADSYKPIQNLESKQLQHDLLTTPDNFRDHLERYAASVIVTVNYGRRVTNIWTDRVVCENRRSMDVLTSVNIPGKYLVESLPILLKLPNFLTPWRTLAFEHRKKDVELYLGLVNEVKEKMERGVAPYSFAKQLIENQEKFGMTDLEVAYTCSTPFGAGVETSSGTLLSFFLACAHAGETFIPKAQAELDRVVGSDRLPTFEDFEDLPYIRAVVNETLRWRPIAVLGGTPHASTEDDWYNGMFIPKGSTVVANLWSIHLNPRDFPDPHRFDPGRFMQKRDYPGKWGHSAFGFGRRICPGMHLAENSIYINIARILWSFNIAKAKDAQGKDIDVDIFSFTDGFNSMPREFPCSIKVRSSQHAAVIEREYADAKEELKQWDDAYQ
ncbi:cytochrome P450 [Rhodotorula paludigena]|uniref:cytochrome P450 n=1 Tax=Rhodotorula paludigena TaxID=86838 RepID=UPI003181F2E3